MSVIDLIDHSGSVNQNTAPHLLALNESPLMVNATQEETGAVGTRLGSNLVGTTISGSGHTQGLGVFVQSDGTHLPLCVAEGNLYKYTTDWTLVSSSVVATSSTVEFANFAGKCYFIGSAVGEYLKSFDGTTVATVSGDIEGKYLSANDIYLLVSGDGRVAYYSNANSETFTPLTDLFTTQLPQTGCVALGEQAPFLIFDEDSVYIVDPARATSDRKGTAGCSSHRSIQVVQGYAIWVNREGFWVFRDTDAKPRKVSVVIENNLSYNAVFNQISGTSFDTIASGQFQSTYYASIGNLMETVQGETLDDCWVVFDVSRNSWNFRTYTANGAGVAFVNFKNSSKTLGMYAASRDSNSIYEIDVDGLFTDDDSTGATHAYTSLHRTKHVVLSGGSKFSATGREKEKQLNASQIKLYNTGDVSISYNFNGATTYSSLTTVTDVTPTGYNWHIQEFNPPRNPKFKTLSLEVRTTARFILYEWNIDVYARANAELKAI